MEDTFIPPLTKIRQDISKAYSLFIAAYSKLKTSKETGDFEIEDAKEFFSLFNVLYTYVLPYTKPQHFEKYKILREKLDFKNVLENADEYTRELIQLLKDTGLVDLEIELPKKTVNIDDCFLGIVRALYKDKDIINLLERLERLVKPNTDTGD